MDCHGLPAAVNMWSTFYGGSQQLPAQPSNMLLPSASMLSCLVSSQFQVVEKLELYLVVYLGYENILKQLLRINMMKYSRQNPKLDSIHRHLGNGNFV